jgi:hypothetical protein
MGILAGLVLIAAGAVLVWGVTATAEGLDVNAIGAILMVVGVLGILLGAVFWSTWGGLGLRRRVVREQGRSTASPPSAPRRVRIVEEREDVASGPPPA